MRFAQAEKAAEAASSWEGRRDSEGGGTPENAAEGSSPKGPPGEGAAKALVDALAMAMYGLAHTGAQRVARLCEVPSSLACWALELLEEQACTVPTAGARLSSTCALVPWKAKELTPETKGCV